MTEENQNFKYILRLVLNVVLPLSGWLLLCLLGPKLLKFFLPFVIGWILAAIANLPVRFLEKRLKRSADTAHSGGGCGPGCGGGDSLSADRKNHRSGFGFCKSTAPDPGVP